MTGKFASVLFADCLKFTHDLVHELHGVVTEIPLTWRWRGDGVLAGEPTLADRRVGQRNHAELCADSEESTGLWGTAQEREFDLIGSEAKATLLKFSGDAASLLG